MILLILIVAGLCLGSFVNALVWRLHEIESQKEKKHIDKKYLKELSIINGRSMCPSCKHNLAAIDLIPLLSWLMLRGRCRYCNSKVSITYPIVELIVATLFVVSYIYWPVKINGLYDLSFALWLIIITGFVALFYYDIKWFRLPTVIIYTLIPVSLLIALLNISKSNDITKSIVNLVLSVLIGGGIFFLIYQFSSGKYIGGGDVRLGWLLGILAMTPDKSLLIIFLASIIGSIYSLILIALNKLKKNSLIAFGPFLIMAAYITQLFGQNIINWYKSLII